MYKKVDTKKTLTSNQSLWYIVWEQIENWRLKAGKQVRCTKWGILDSFTVQQIWERTFS